MHASLQWRCVGAALCGQRNRAEGRSGEDAWARCSRPAAEGSGRILAVCLADGAGCASQAAAGAQLVTRTAARWACRHFQWVLRASVTSVGDRLLELLQRRLQQAALANSSGMDEFASTLILVAVAADGTWFTAHLGDGAILARQVEQLLPLSLPQKGELANETFFVTSDLAAEMIRIRRSVDPGTPDQLSGFVLFTDGVEHHLVNRRTGEIAVASGKLLQWLDQAPEAVVRRALRTTLNDVFLPLTNDDCSLALVAAAGAASTATSPPPVPQGVSPECG